MALPPGVNPDDSSDYLHALNLANITSVLAVRPREEACCLHVTCCSLMWLWRGLLLLLLLLLFVVVAVLLGGAAVAFGVAVAVVR